MPDFSRDTVFTDAISSVYEHFLVPLIFEPYAGVLADRVAAVPGVSRLLECAAGTGVLTRALASRLPASAAITATDLNQAMIDQAAHVGTSRAVAWQQADALRLPFADGSFDVVVCQFGAMFFPDKARAFAEARRVLRDGGVFFFTVWDRIEENEFADVVTAAVQAEFPRDPDPPAFLRRTPHGYHDPATIARDVVGGGFHAPAIETLAARSRADSPATPAIAYCQGTPMRNEIEARAPHRLVEITEVATAAMRRRYGDGAVDGKIQAHLITVAR